MNENLANFNVPGLSKGIERDSESLTLLNNLKAIHPEQYSRSYWAITAFDSTKPFMREIFSLEFEIFLCHYLKLSSEGTLFTIKKNPKMLSNIRISEQSFQN